MTATVVRNGSACPAPRHLPGVTGAATINTSGLREIRVNLEALFGHSHVYLVDGEPGVGKTFGVRTALTELDLPTFWVDMSDTPRGKEATSRVFTAVMGRRPPRTMTDYELQEETVDALVGLVAVLAIDEAQNLTRSALRALRYLWERPATQVLLTLVGPGVFNAVRQVPEMDSRVSRRTLINGLRGARGIALVRELHPLLDATDEKTLIEIAATVGGNLRNWMRVIEVAQSLALSSSAGLSPDDVKQIRRQITGTT